MASTRPLARALGVFALVGFLIAPTALAWAEDSDPVIARVNGVEIHRSDLALAEDEVGSSMPQQMSDDQKREYLITYLADIVILSQAAQKQNVGDRPDVKHRVEFERNKVLMETLLQDTGKAALTDDAMHKVYDEAVKQMPEAERAEFLRNVIEVDQPLRAIRRRIRSQELSSTAAAKNPSASAPAH